MEGRDGVSATTLKLPGSSRQVFLFTVSNPFIIIDDIRADSAMIYAHAQLRVNGELCDGFIWWTMMDQLSKASARKTSTP